MAICYAVHEQLSKWKRHPDLRIRFVYYFYVWSDVVSLKCVNLHHACNFSLPAATVHFFFSCQGLRACILAAWQDQFAVADWLQ